MSLSRRIKKIKQLPELKDILAGNTLAGARTIRLIEESDPRAFDLLKQLYPYAGSAFIIGITGSPGVGKSTLINALVAEYRELDKKIAVIAVDPTSPLSGGAILGDRIRMQNHAADKNVFIRSMASRGEKGGLSKAVKDSLIVLDAMGFEIIIIETVGAGQTQFDIKDLAHSVGVVTIPGAGDGIQAVKAGIFETGDIFIVNKSDRQGSEKTFQQLNMMLDMKTGAKADSGFESVKLWKPDVFKTNARTRDGVKEVSASFLAHFDFMSRNRVLETRKKEMENLYFNALLKDLALNKLIEIIKTSDQYFEAVKKIESRDIDPLSAAQILVDNIIEI